MDRRHDFRFFPLSLTICGRVNSSFAVCRASSGSSAKPIDCFLDPPPNYSTPPPPSVTPITSTTTMQGPFPWLQQALREPREGADVGGGVPGPCGQLCDGGAADPRRLGGGRPRARGAQDDVRMDRERESWGGGSERVILLVSFCLWGCSWKCQYCLMQ